MQPDFEDGPDVVLSDGKRVRRHAEHDDAQLVRGEVKEGDRQGVGDDRRTQDSRRDVLAEQETAHHDEGRVERDRGGHADEDSQGDGAGDVPRFAAQAQKPVVELSEPVPDCHGFKGCPAASVTAR